MQAFSFLVGMSCGAAIGLVLFCYMVPHGPKAIKMLRHYSSHMKGQVNVAEMNREEFRKLYDDTGAQVSANDHSMHTMNPYMMSAVTSEKQFLRDMILHHESAVVMAEQVLVLPNVHKEVKNLAEEIIKAQSTEISQMKSWMKTWGMK